MADNSYRFLWHQGNPKQGYYTDFDAPDAGTAGWEAHESITGMIAGTGTAPVLVSVTELPAADPAPAHDQG